MVDIAIGVALVSLGIILIVGTLVFTTVQTSINQDAFTAQANTTIASITNNVLSAFSLAGVAAIVIGAAFIIRNIQF